jgi:ABC-type molybdate transport system substrate-binding protein
MTQVQDCVARFNSVHSEVQAVVRFGGSVDCIRRMRAGEPCDVLISADDTLLASMVFPKYAGGYCVFAGNQMALISLSNSKRIDSANWIQQLTDPDTRFGHFSPTRDPGGYRAVMTCMLSDSVQPGLAKTLLEHPGRVVITGPGRPPVDFMFTYASGPISKGHDFASLPVEMNLSDPALNDHYATAFVDLDGDGTNVVRGSAIAHGLAIPYSAQQAGAAAKFVDLFLQTDFVRCGFLPRTAVVGNWPGAQSTHR